MSKKRRIEQVGDPLSLGPVVPAYIRKKYQHHPTAGAFGITGYSGLDSYHNDYEGDGYCNQSLTKYKREVRPGQIENFNCVQGPLGKRGILHRMGNK